MVVALRLAVVAGALGTFLVWQAGLSWLWPWLALATCAGFTAAAFFGGDTTAGSRKLRRPVTGTLRAVEAGVTDNHGHAAWMSMKEAMRLFPGGTPAYGGVVVGEAYRVCEDQVAEIAFAPRDERSWGKGRYRRASDISEKSAYRKQSGVDRPSVSLFATRSATLPSGWPTSSPWGSMPAWSMTTAR